MPMESPMIYAMSNKYLSLPASSARWYHCVMSHSVNAVQSRAEAYTSDSTPLNQNVSEKESESAPITDAPKTSNLSVFVSTVSCHILITLTKTRYNSITVSALASTETILIRHAGSPNGSI